MKFWYNIFFFWVIYPSLYAQSSLSDWEKKSMSLSLVEKESYLNQISVDSLELFLQKTQNPTFKVDLMNAIAFLGRVNQFDKCTEYTDKAYKLAKSQNYRYGECIALQNKARCLSLKGDLEDTRNIAKQSLQIAQAINYPLGIANANKIIGYSFEAQGNYGKALEYYLNTIKIIEKNQYEKQQIAEYYNLAFFYDQQENYTQATVYYQKAIALAQKANNHFYLYRFNSAFALTLKNQKKYKEALKVIRQNIQDIQNATYKEKIPDLSVAYQVSGLIYTDLQTENPKDTNAYQEALNYLYKTANMQLSRRKIVIPETYHALAKVYENAQQYDSAWVYFQKSLQSAYTRKNKQIISHTHNLIASFLLNRKEYAKAKTEANQALQIALEIKIWREIQEAYRLLTEIAAQQQDFQNAYTYHILFKKYSDSLKNENTSNKIAQLDLEYNFEKRERELNEQTKKQNELKQSEIFYQTRLRNLFLIILIIVSFLLFLLFRTYRKQIINAKTLSNQKNEIEKKNKRLEIQREIMEKAYYKSKEANEKLQKANIVIQEKKEEVESQAEELRQANEEIKSINQNLERIIEDRTSNLIKAYGDLAKTNQELDTFLYRSSHDLRRPLTTLMGLRELAQLILNDDIGKDLFEKVNITVVNMDKMLGKLLMIHDINNIESKFIEVNFEEILANIHKKFNLALHQKNIQWIQKIEPNINLLSHPDLITFILQNLIENSIAFCQEEGGIIQIHIHLKSIHTICMDVQDNGLGIDANYQEQIFDMYYRANEKSQGNGLGLYIVKKAIDKLKGSISFETELNKGATFSVLIPHYEK